VVDARKVRFEHPDLKVIVQSPLVERVLELATVQAHHVGVLFIDGDFIATLPPGRYAFWKNMAQVKFVQEDLREAMFTGQSSFFSFGSGGPFRGWTHTELQRASVKEALQHPVWSMGPKITIDSATLMNKGLEVIEAHYLFDLEYSQIHVLIHPEGLVHGMAEFRDGSLRAEMATADMRLPIQLALAWPERLPAGVDQVPLTDKGLTFEPVDREAFPAVDLAYRVGGLGLTFPAVMNAANEVAVMAFLEGKIPLPRIVDVVQTVVDDHEPASVVSVVNIERADAWARHRAAEIIEER